MCEQRNWNTSRLLLALPHSDHMKSNVVIYTYSNGNYRTQSLVEWVYGLMKQKVRPLNSTTDVSRWLSNSCAADVCLLLVSTLTLPPFFLSALSIKFTGRVKFATCSQRTLRNSVAAQQLSIATSSDDVQSPAHHRTDAPEQNHPHPSDNNTGEYVMVSDGQAVHYGRIPRERLSFSVLQTYLKWLAPDINDVFLLSLGATNILALMSLFDLRGSPIQCTLQLLMSILKYNFCLLLVWVAILSVSNWRGVVTLCKFLSTLIRRFTLSNFGRRFIAEWSLASDCMGLLGFSFFVYNSAIYYLRRRFYPSSLSQTESWADWLRSTNFNVPLIPEMPTLFGGRSTWWSGSYYINNDHLMLESMDPRLSSLIRRWAIQQIYVNPIVSYNYILDLPSWYYDIKPDEQNFDMETGGSYGCTRKLCFRCQCVKSLNLKKLSRKLNRRPCSKCGYSGHQNDRICVVAEEQPISRSVDNAACPICIDSFNRGDILCGLPCDHVYHQRCILGWLLRDQPSCPCCRWPAFERKEKIS